MIMKKVTCAPCSGILGLIIDEPDREVFIELYREFIVCLCGSHDRTVEDYAGDPDIETQFYQAD